ncbi:transcriptional regulator NrdR [Candidatus Woesebacteria bacterium]|nr:transcriptional regulator NrdR [Candidatus Woesebacteria bacterium]MCD8527319.1 transcriptional regulator NrdR [Candidatus Woesebacteria bacterium]MCD8546683.1 transcriptional regulator NrdR [Candidatus Woesebacteria bacterium]
MRCPYCSHTATSVLESRLTSDAESIRRRRTCDNCGKRFTTYERVEGVDLSVVKKNGSTETFDREKLRKGIVKATWKRPVSMSDIEELLDDVERRLRVRKTTKIKSWEIGNLVMNRLKKLDPVAYLLFASVYKDFQSLDDFEGEITRLQDSPAPNRAETNCDTEEE